MYEFGDTSRVLSFTDCIIFEDKTKNETNNKNRLGNTKKNYTLFFQMLAIHSITGRLGLLGIATLNLVNMIIGVAATLPSLGYLSALDVYFIVSLIFIGSNYVEVCLLHHWMSERNIHSYTEKTISESSSTKSYAANKLPLARLAYYLYYLSGMAVSK